MKLSGAALHVINVIDELRVIFMTDAKREEHIDLLLGDSDKRQILIDKIQDTYEKYRQNMDESVFEELLRLLEREDFCKKWIRTQLWRTGCYSEDNEHDVLQDSRIAIWQSILNGKVADNFAYYAFGIYKIKTLDLIRKVSKNRAKVNTVSLDDPIGDGNQTIADTIPGTQPNYGESDDKRKLYVEVFRIYCKSITNTNAFVPRCLALFYARVLSHLLEEIPDSKATSAKWAFERMRNLSVGNLTDDSEKIMQEDIDSKLAWGPLYVGQLDDIIDATGRGTILRKIIYTDTYDKGKIEDWADSMHNTTVKVARKEIAENSELVDGIETYVSSESALMSLLSTKEGKSR